MCQAYDGERGLVDLLHESYRRDCEQGNHHWAAQGGVVETATRKLRYGIYYYPVRCRYCSREVNLVLTEQEKTEHAGTHLSPY